MQFVGPRAEQFISSLHYSQQLSYIITHFPSTVFDLRLSTAFTSPSILPSLVHDLLALITQSKTLLESTTTNPAVRNGIAILLMSKETGFSVVLTYLLHPTQSTQDAREELLRISRERRQTVAWFHCAAGCLNGVPHGERGGGELMACGRVRLPPLFSSFSCLRFAPANSHHFRI